MKNGWASSKDDASFILHLYLKGRCVSRFAEDREAVSLDCSAHAALWKDSLASAVTCLMGWVFLTRHQAWFNRIPGLCEEWTSTTHPCAAHAFLTASRKHCLSLCCHGSDAHPSALCTLPQAALFLKIWKIHLSNILFRTTLWVKSRMSELSCCLISLRRYSRTFQYCSYSSTHRKKSCLCIGRKTGRGLAYLPWTLRAPVWSASSHAVSTAYWACGR